MFRKIISLITLAALMLNITALTGCTKLVKVPAGAVKIEPQKKVTRLKLKTGGYVRWNTNGAVYVHQAELFDGVSGDGQRQRTHLGKVDSVYFVPGEATTERALDTESFHHDFIKKGRDSIRGQIESVMWEKGAVVFTDNTARIDTAAQSVVGITNWGDTVEIPLAQVQSFGIRRDSPTRTLLLVAGIALVALSIAFAAAGPYEGMGGY